MLSVIIITKNEAFNIKHCLQSIAWADEIIVLDSGSTDNTVEIALQFTDKVYLKTDWQGYGIQKQRALQYATKEWVLNLDADEWVDDAAKTSILQSLAQDMGDAYRIPITMVFYNKPLRYSSSPKRHIRLFKRQGAYYSDSLVHEKIILPEKSRILQLKTPIYHNSYRDLSHALSKLNQYSSQSAKMRLKTRAVSSFAMVLLNTFWMFNRCYFLKLGFLDGKAGFIFAAYNATGTYYRGMKQIYPDF